jgi:ubiquinone/menaquinone biosynthesis C-methylase UbiE
MRVSSVQSVVGERRRRDDTRELLVLAQASLRAWERVLWLSCGDGWGPEEAWRRMRKGYVCGLDRSSEQVSQAHQLRAVPHTLEFRCWDGSAVPCVARSFNHVISCAAIGASPQPQGLLSEIRRVLVAGGSLSLVETSDISPQTGAATPTASQLVAMLVTAGFAQVACVQNGDGWLIGSARQPA